MHDEILTEEQKMLLPLVQRFSGLFYLVGGTAVALQIGHRRSIDFDLFTIKPFKNLKIRKIIGRSGKINRVFKDEDGQFTIILNNIQFTFFNYPFAIDCPVKFSKIIKMPNLLTLAAMKAYALGRRAKWKDYVDLYFIIRDCHPVNEIIKKGKEIFGAEFNERIFRVQLAYFRDINYAEKVEFLPGLAVSDSEIKKSLRKFSLSK